MSVESHGALLGNSTTGASPRQPWRHATVEELLEVVFSTGSNVRQTAMQQCNKSHHATPRRQERNYWRRCFLLGPCRGVTEQSSRRRELELSWSEWVERRQLVSSAQELTAERKYQLKPAVRGWREMVVSLQGREPGSRGTSAVENRCQAKLVKTEESSLVRQLVSSETVNGPAGRQPWVGG
jgi:hypothetical protein